MEFENSGDDEEFYPKHNHTGKRSAAPVFGIPAYAEELEYPTSTNPRPAIPKSAAGPVSAVDEPREERDILELLGLMDDFEPLIPEALTDYYMTKCGVECDDTRLKKLVALVAQKFISDVAMDAMEYSRMSMASATAGLSEAARKAAILKKKQTLGMEDLSAALAEHGINLRKPPYHL